jgi:predicted ABC-type ATPase
VNRNLYIIAGCNGAGKTTASYTILPEILDCKEFINADEIARGLSPFQPEKMAVEAGKIMIKRIETLLANNKNFAFETTLAAKSYKNTIARAKDKGYNVTLLFFWLQTVDLAKQRVRARVLSGGHNIEKDLIERRYAGGIKNLFDIYIPLVNIALIFDNSEGKQTLIAKKVDNSDILIIDEYKFNKLKEYYENNEEK